MEKFTEIVRAWLSAVNPSKKEKEIAEYRSKICELCPHKVELNNSLLTNLTSNQALLAKYKCNACGCPLAKKIFTINKDSCPLKKWKK